MAQAAPSRSSPTAASAPGKGAGRRLILASPVLPGERRWQLPRYRSVLLLAFFLSLPGLAVALVVLAAVDRLGVWARGRSGLPWFRDGRRPASAPALDELQAMFHATKRHSIEQHKLELVLRDDEHDGAPPRVRVDLAACRAVITSGTAR